MPDDALPVELRADLAAEILDLAQVHLVWSGRHLQEGRYEHALAAFRRLLDCVREASTEMAAIRAKLPIVDEAMAEAAREYQANRPRRVA